MRRMTQEFILTLSYSSAGPSVRTMFRPHFLLIVLKVPKCEILMAWILMIFLS